MALLSLALADTDVVLLPRYGWNRSFDPKSLERGCRSEKASKLAVVMSAPRDYTESPSV